MELGWATCRLNAGLSCFRTHPYRTPCVDGRFPSSDSLLHMICVSLLRFAAWVGSTFLRPGSSLLRKAKTIIEQAVSLSTASVAARANRELLSVCMFSPSRFEVTLSPLGALDLRESTDKCRCVDQQDVHRTGRIAFYSISGRTRQSRTAHGVDCVFRILRSDVVIRPAGCIRQI